MRWRPTRAVYQNNEGRDTDMTGRLEGKVAFITGAALSGAIGELPASGLISVQVPESAYNDAAPIAAEIDGWLTQKPIDSADFDEDTAPVTA